MNKQCKRCSIELNEETAVKLSCGNIRRICRKCRSKQVMEYNTKSGDKRRAYIVGWLRKVGRVKQYPCITCNESCYKKYALAFCSDKCRFLHYIDKQDSCWIWTGAKNHQGYGKLSFQGYSTAPAHRVSYLLFNGPIEDDLLVCHSCDVRSCVNPDHLWLGTNQDNMIDMTQKGRQASNLTPLDVLNIRKLAEKAEVSYAYIAHKYKITSGHLSNILSRRIWKHV